MNTLTRFGSASFYRNALTIAIPVMLQVLLQNMVSLIDNFMVAGLGDVKMSGVNIANQLLFVYFVMINVLASAGGIFMSQFNGAKDSEGMKQTFRFKLLTTLTIAGIITVICVALPGQMLGILVNTNSARDAIVFEGRNYLRVIVWTFFPIAISMSIGSSLRETGNVRPPLIISVAATLVNTFFNWVFIYGNLGAPRMEVEGAALATIIARLVELAAFIAYARATKASFYIRWMELFRVNAKLFGSILRKSGILFVSELSWVLTETVMTAVYNGRGGAEIVSGMAAGWAIANLFFLVFSAIHTSIGVIVGGTLGRNELDQAKQEAKWLRSGSIVIGFAVAICEAASVLLIPLVFGNLSPDARLVTRHLLWVIAIYLPVWTYLNAQLATGRAGGDAIMGVWVDVLVNSTMFLPGIFILAFCTGYGPIEMYAIVKLTDLVKVGIAHWQLGTGRWLKNLTTEHRTPEAAQ
jgi:putative MATE family efflux protein